MLDEVTGEPAQGAIVVAVWTLSDFSSKVFYAAEGVVGANGEYEIHGVPLRLRPFGNALISSLGDPQEYINYWGRGFWDRLLRPRFIK